MVVDCAGCRLSTRYGDIEDLVSRSCARGATRLYGAVSSHAMSAELGVSHSGLSPDRAWPLWPAMTNGNLRELSSVQNITRCRKIAICVLTASVSFLASSRKLALLCWLVTASALSPKVPAAMTPAAAAIISRWIFPGVVPLYASDVTRDRQKGLQRLGTRDLP
ncbi:hypothetical protein F441_07331 [Phytophthora nicotianae CJ01A1]|uniref:Uncharacterized protein n=2 Tax=Phytophthora nicotianae TaxID=4792 RepID=V9FD06_PHYNI|nr:hypothetical protein F443_07331 [Phytophthora nicotianae P1569]ETP18444.1 hypothetical protein F441_07331 [Phytophthora nicotianae CJ01A1]